MTLIIVKSGIALMVLQLTMDKPDTAAATSVRAIRGNSHRGSGKDDPVDKLISAKSVIMTTIDTIATPVQATHVNAIFRTLRLYWS